ncbi:MAG: hypothetical protein ABSA27_16505 [Terriglobales bacterium]
MTIVVICTLVLNAVVTVLLVGYGLWFRNIVKQQLNAKDTTIETLNAAITSHQAEISILKGDRAPVITAEYKIMREHADQMTADKQALDEQVKKLTESQKEGAKMHQVEKVMSEIDGLRFASELLMNPFNRYTSEFMSPEALGAHETLLQNFMLDTMDVMTQIGLEMGSRNKDVKRVLDEKLTMIPIDDGDV